MGSVTKSSGYIRTASADDSGFIYETKMSALVTMRLFNNYDEFHVASNMGNAGKFDDIVFSARKGRHWSSYFIQLKHKHVKKKKVSRSALYYGAQGKDDFSVSKYFQSYINMLQMFCEDGDVIFGKPFASAKFIVFTNSMLHDEVLNLNHQHVDMDFLSTNPDVEVNFQLNAETDRELISYLNAASQKMVCLELFLKQFYFCSGQVEEYGIDQLVCEEIKKATELSPNEVANVVGQLYDHVRRKHREGQYLTRDDITTLITKANFYAQSGKKSVASVKFTKSYLSELEKDLVCGTPVFLTCVTDKTLMCMAALKQLGLLDDPNHEFSLRNMEGDEFYSLLDVWKEKDQRTLVIDCDVDAYLIDQILIVQRLRELCKNNPSNRIILVAGKANTVATKLATDVNGIKRRFNCTLKNLADESKNLLYECNLKFQGYETPLSSLTCGWKLLDDVFDMASMTSLLAGGKIDVGIKPVEHINYYIPRVLNRKKTVDEDVFRGPSRRNTFVVSGITVEEAVRLLPFDSAEIGSSPITLTPDGLPDKKVYVVDGLGYSVKLEKSFGTKSNVHWIEHSLKYKTGWVWRRSNGNIDLILNNVTSALEYVSTDNVMSIEDKVVVVAAEPGMGKSTLLDHLAAQTKTLCPHMWVISLQLNDFSDHLSNKNFIKNIKTNVKNLIAAAAGVDSTTSKFNARLFNHCYDVTGNMIVLLDGFDEITPSYTKEGIELVKTLQESIISRVWVTTRPVWASLLQSVTSTLSFTIQALGVKEQKSFLHKFWGRNNEDIDIEDLNVFIEKVLKLVSGSISSDLNEFTGIPLQTRMVAEAFDPKQELPAHINGLQLFEKFVETKIEISFRDKLKIASTNARMLSEVRSMRERLEEKLMQLGLLTLLSLEDCSKLEPPISQKTYEDLRKYVQDGEEIAGLVVSFMSESPQFIHRTFAEYFAAKFLADRYNTNRTFLVSDTFFSPLFSFVQYFFNRILAKDIKIHEAVLQHFIFLDPEYIKEHCNEKDKGGRTPLHLAASAPHRSYNIDYLLALGADPNIADGVLDWKPLDFAIHLKISENIGPLLEVSKPTSELGNIVPITWESLRMALSGDYLQLLLYLLDKNIAASVGMHVLCMKEWIDDCHNPGPFKKLTLLHVAAWYNASKILAYLLSPTSRDCKLSQLECLDDKGRTPLLLASSNHSVNAVKLLLDADANIFAKTGNGRNIMELAVFHLYSDIISTVLASMHVRNLPPDELLRGAVSALMGLKSDWAVSTLRSLFLSYPKQKNITTKKNVPLITAAAIKGNDLMVAFLMKEANANANVVHKGSTPLHFAIRGGHLETVKVLLQCPSLQLNIKDNNGDTPYSLAKQFEDSEVVELLLKYAKENSSSYLETFVTPKTETVNSPARRRRKKVRVEGNSAGVEINSQKQLTRNQKNKLNLAPKWPKERRDAVNTSKPEAASNSKEAQNKPQYWAVGNGYALTYQMKKITEKARSIDQNKEPILNVKEARSEQQLQKKCETKGPAQKKFTEMTPVTDLYKNPFVPLFKEGQSRQQQQKKLKAKGPALKKFTEMTTAADPFRSPYGLWRGGRTELWQQTKAEHEGPAPGHSKQNIKEKAPAKSESQAQEHEARWSPFASHKKSDKEKNEAIDLGAGGPVLSSNDIGKQQKYKYKPNESRAPHRWGILDLDPSSFEFE